MDFLPTGNISPSNVDGPVAAMQLSLKEAGMDASGIDYINAHATSTPAGDESPTPHINGIFNLDEILPDHRINTHFR